MMAHPVLHCTGQGKSVIKHVDLMAAYDASTDAETRAKPSYLPDNPLELPGIVLSCCKADTIDGLLANGFCIPAGWERAEPKFRRIMDK